MINLLNELLSSINKHRLSTFITKYDNKNSGNPDQCWHAR